MRGMARLLTSELWDGPRPRCFRVPCPRRHARANAPATLVQADDARDEQEGGAEEGESSQAVSELGFWEGADPDLEPLEPELQPEGGGVLGELDSCGLGGLLALGHPDRSRHRQAAPVAQPSARRVPLLDVEGFDNVLCLYGLSRFYAWTKHCVA